MTAALGDLRILDFSRVLAGPFATMVLADFGATVVKVERPGTGDETRNWGPPFDAAGRATYFASVNRNKQSIALDLAAAEDLAQARELARRSHVIVENFRPGVMDRLGLGYEQLGAADPSLIYCSITGFGSGPGAELPAYDLLVQALGGLMSVTGTPDGEPQKVGVALVDVLAGSFAALGILTALRHRDATGAGQRIEVDLLSSLLAALVNQGSAYTIAGEVPGRMGNSHPSIAPYELFDTGEGSLVLAVGNDRQFAALCAVIGDPDLAVDRQFSANPERVANRRELRDRLQARLHSGSARDWAQRLTAARVPAGVINDVGEAFALAGSLGLEPIVSIARDDGSTVSLTRSPIRLSLTPARYVAPPPELGVAGRVSPAARTPAPRRSGDPQA